MQWFTEKCKMHRNTIYKASEQKSSNLQRKTLKDLQRRTIAREHLKKKKSTKSGGKM